MKNWKLTTAIAATAVLTATFAYLYGTEDKNVAAPADNTAAAPESAKPMDWSFLPDIVATYGDKKIMKEDFIKNIEDIISAAPNSGGRPPMNSDIIKAIAPRIINTIIDKRILVDIAKSEGITPSSGLVIEEFDEILKTAPKEETEKFEAALKAKNSSIEQYKKELAENNMAHEDAAINRWVKTKIQASISVADADVKKYYDENQDAFTKPETVNASHVLVKSGESQEEIDAAKKKCEQIKTDIDSGKSTFEGAAEEFSDCPSGKKAKGNLGNFGRPRRAR